MRPTVDGRSRVHAYGVYSTPVKPKNHVAKHGETIVGPAFFVKSEECGRKEVKQ